MAHSPPPLAPTEAAQPPKSELQHKHGFDLSRYEKVEKVESDIAIVGAGLAGLALALGLQQRGIKAELFERRAWLSSDTATVIGIGPNGVTALEGIHPGLSKILAELGTYTTNLKVDVVREGSIVYTNTVKYEEGIYVTVCWKLVHQCLSSFVHRDTVHCLHKLLFYEESKGGVDAYFEVKDEENASMSHVKILSTKLLVGADGIWSAVRKQMIGDEPRYLNLVDWNAVVYNPDKKLIKCVDKGEIYACTEENAETWSLSCNAGDYTLWILRKLDRMGDIGNSLLKKHGGLGNPGSKDRALKNVEGLKRFEFLQAAIKATNEDLIFERKLMDRLPIDRWSDANGRILLIGDAAHSQYVGPGQGARTAFEDAHQLSIFLEEANQSSFSEESIKFAVQRFEKLRIPRMKKMQEYAAHSTRLPWLQPEWVQKLTPEEKLKRQREYVRWVESYPNNQEGDPGSTYFK